MLARYEPPLETCGAVVVEAWYLLGRAKRGRQTLLRLLDSPNIAVTFSLVNDANRVFKLMSKYADQPMSVADACLVRMAEVDAGATIVTLDSDFGVYRRGRSTLRLAAPFVASSPRR